MLETEEDWIMNDRKERSVSPRYKYNLARQLFRTSLILSSDNQTSRRNLDTVFKSGLTTLQE